MIRIDAPEDQVRLGAAAGKGLAHGIAEEGGVPGHGLPGRRGRCLSLGGGDGHGTRDDALHPGGGAEPGRYDQSARRLRLTLLADLDHIAGRGVRLRADEEVVHRQQGLAVRELRLGHRHRLDVAPVAQHVRQQQRQVAGLEGQQDAVPAEGVRIDADDGLAVEVLEGVGHQPVLAQGDDDVVAGEDEVGQEAALDHLEATVGFQCCRHEAQRLLVGLVLALVVGEVGAQVLQVEAGLGHRVVLRDQVLQPGAARDQDELAFTGRAHGQAPGRRWAG